MFDTITMEEAFHTGISTNGFDVKMEDETSAVI